MTGMVNSSMGFKLSFENGMLIDRRKYLTRFINAGEMGKWLFHQFLMIVTKNLSGLQPVTACKTISDGFTIAKKKQKKNKNQTED